MEVSLYIKNPTPSLTLRSKKQIYVGLGALYNWYAATHGSDDFYLPSITELGYLHDELYLYGPPYSSGLFGVQWSSTEFDSNNAYYYNLVSGDATYSLKNTGWYSSPIRQFTSTTAYSLRDMGPTGGYIFHINGNTYWESSKKMFPVGNWSTAVSLSISFNNCLAPIGWHLPSREEIYVLGDNLGGGHGNGGKLKSTGFTNWNPPNLGATNEFGFNAFGSGTRNGDTGSFGNLKTLFHGWLSNIYPLSIYGSIWELGNYYQDLIPYRDGGYGDDTKNYGASIRYIKNDSIPADCVDIDNNNYGHIVIGTQVWAGSNFKGIHYNDHTLIPEVTDNSAWVALSTEAMCWFNNIAA
jgi:uncharacterized protein (TIGR02145 family)